MAQSYLESMLGEHERIIYVTRQHWFLLVSSILLEIVLIVVILAAAVTGAIMAPSGFTVIIVVIGCALILLPIISMVKDILQWTNHEYIVTNRRVIQVQGIFDKTVTDSSLEKVNDVKLVQSALGRVFDYGDVEILTASEIGMNVSKRIEGPVRFKIAMLNAKRELENGENRLGIDLPSAPITKQAPAQPAQPEPLRLTDLPDLLAKMEGLRQTGVLTNEEFQQKKTELLKKYS
jgi:membrane protein YdbS with pleckstrin-like domain